MRTHFRMRAAVIVAFALLLGSASPAAANHTHFTMLGITEPYTTFLAQSQMPTPRGAAHFHTAATPGDMYLACLQQAAGCWLNASGDLWIKDPPTYSDGTPIAEPDASKHRRFTFYHELGHVFDYRIMTRRQRYLFKRITGQSQVKGWFPTSGKQPGETFADAYARCAFFGDILPADTSAAPGPPNETGYGLTLRGDDHTRACRLMRRASRNRHVTMARTQHVDVVDQAGNAYNPADQQNHAWLFHASDAYNIEYGDVQDSRSWDGSIGAKELVDYTYYSDDGGTTTASCDWHTTVCPIEPNPGPLFMNEKETGSDYCDDPDDFPGDPEDYRSADSTYVLQYTPVTPIRMHCGAHHANGSSWLILAGRAAGDLFK